MEAKILAIANKSFFCAVILVIACSKAFSLPFSNFDKDKNNQLLLANKYFDKAESMDDITRKKKEILNFIKSYSVQHGIPLKGDISQQGDYFVITIYHDDKNNFLTDTKSDKKITKEEFLKLNKNEIEKIVTKLVKDPDDYPHPGPNLTP